MPFRIWPTIRRPEARGIRQRCGCEAADLHGQLDLVGGPVLPRIPSETFGQIDLAMDTVDPVAQADIGKPIDADIDTGDVVEGGDEHTGPVTAAQKKTGSDTRDVSALGNHHQDVRPPGHGAILSPGYAHPQACTWGGHRSC